MQPSSENEIHGHDVMQMMLESGQPFDAASLESAIHARFGEEARFCTCSASGMTARELIAFLAERGKFVPTGDGFSTDASKICNH
ncbi:MAG: YecH family protein [Planctomycetales bacterium]|nr:YecH family protein [Planctomycetales bacterium]